MKQAILLTYFVVTHAIIPLILFGWAITLYKKYSLSSFVNIFFASFLIALPLVQFLLLGFAATGGGEVTSKVFLISFIPAGVIALAGGLIGLLLNSVYILILRLMGKA